MLCKICELRIKFFIEVIRVSDNISSFATQQINRLNVDENKDFHANRSIIACFHFKDCLKLLMLT